jgi:hypothetical protein
VNKTIWEAALDELGKVWAQRNSGLLLHLLTDNLAMHREEDILRFAKKRLIKMYLLPPNTTHFLQPFDDLPFAIYKVELRRLADLIGKSRVRLGQSIKDSVELATLVSLDVEKVAFAKDKIVAAFENTGIWPWSPNLILSHAKRNVGDPEVKKEYHEESLRELSARIHGETLAKARDIVAASEVGKERVTVSVKYNFQYDTDTILAHSDALFTENVQKEEAKRQKEAEREENKAKKEAAKRDREEARLKKLTHSCRVKFCKRKWDDAQLEDWVFCEFCDKFAVCPMHWRKGESEQGQITMIDHEAECKRTLKRSRRGQ